MEKSLNNLKRQCAADDVSLERSAKSRRLEVDITLKGSDDLLGGSGSGSNPPANAEVICISDDDDEEEKIDYCSFAVSLPDLRDGFLGISSEPFFGLAPVRDDNATVPSSKPGLPEVLVPETAGEIGEVINQNPRATLGIGPWEYHIFDPLDDFIRTTSKFMKLPDNAIGGTNLPANTEIICLSDDEEEEGGYLALDAPFADLGDALSL
ncbi:hypothetical protein SAY86_001948 [Trapa natans]|uniref:Uncharacterized protein n=1 Tax=Trapa natans TaxID=22666 RepID=A0AAN7LID7_TRANT|nr:hypothetical protein SAY86_001948 [Trapa natans]